jgi:hypothetical protein
MTTYTEILNGEIDQDSPVTQPLMTALRDNPLAIAEGTSGAPKVQGKAFENVYIGAVNGTGTTESAVVLPDGVKLIKLEVSGTVAASSIIFQVAYSTDGGTTYGSWQTALTPSVASNYMGNLMLNTVTGASAFVGIVTAGSIGGGPSVTASANAIKFRMSTSGGGTHTYRVLVYVFGGVA